MAKEYNLEENSAYFASDKIKDFVKKQSSFDRLMMSTSVLPILVFDFVIAFSVYLAVHAAIRTPSYWGALFFASVFCVSALSLNLFEPKFRFDRWQSLLLSLKAGIVSYSLTLGVAAIWLTSDISAVFTTTASALFAGGMVYMAHWYMARGLRNHAFHFVIMGEPTPTTISLLKEVRRPREVVSYRHIHKLYQELHPNNLSDAKKTAALFQSQQISSVVLTNNHKPNKKEESFLFEIRERGIEVIYENELWERITKSAAIFENENENFVKQLQAEPSTLSKKLNRTVEATFSALLLIGFAPLFFILYVIASLKMGNHAIVKQSFVGRYGNIFTAKVLVFNGYNRETHKELKIGLHAQNSMFEKICWKTGIWKFPLLLSVIKGDMSLVGAPLLACDPNTHTQTKEKIQASSLDRFILSTLKPGIVSHFELTEQEPTYFDSPLRSPQKYTLYYSAHQSLLLNAYLITLSTIHKIIGRSPTRSWIEV